MSDNLISLPIDQDNEGKIIVNIIQSDDNREYFIKYGNYKQFRLNHLKVIAWSVIELSKINSSMDLDTIIVKSKSCPIRFNLEYETLLTITTTYEVTSLENFQVHLEKLRTDHIKSEVVNAASDSIITVCMNPKSTVSDLRERTKYLSTIIETGLSASNLEFKGMDTLVPQFIKEKNLNAEKYTTGFTQLDAYLTEGLKPGQITTVAGLSSAGKSSLVLSMMKNLSHRGIPTAQFALEMTNMSLIAKLLAFNSTLALSDIVSDPDKLSKPERDRYDHELTRLERNKFVFFNDKPSQGIPQIREQVMLLQDKLKTEYIVVPIDLFGKIKEFQGSDNLARSYEQNINQVQIMARELNVHLILVAQINRSVANRKNKRPSMNDLKNSGALTEASDIVLGVHRPYYNPDVAIKGNIIDMINKQGELFEGEDKDDLTLDIISEITEDERNKNIAEVIILKQRMGQNNVLVNFLFDPNTTCFRVITEDYQNQINKNKFDLEE